MTGTGTGVGQPDAGAAAGRRAAGCSASPSTSCGWPFTPKGWRRAPSISANGRRIFWSGCTASAKLTADPELIKLYNDLRSYPLPARSGPVSPDNVAIPFKLRHHGEVLSFISTTMVFGTPVDVTLSELALETFFPADELTARRLKEMQPRD